MLIAPGYIQSFAVEVQSIRSSPFARDGPKAVLVIDDPDARDRRKFEASLAGIGEELDGPHPITAWSATRLAASR